jgi:hypothetical protein
MVQCDQRGTGLALRSADSLIAGVVTSRANSPRKTHVTAGNYVSGDRGQEGNEQEAEEPRSPASEASDGHETGYPDPPAEKCHKATNSDERTPKVLAFNQSRAIFRVVHGPAPFIH